MLMAYQISPTKGSEYSVGWNVAVQLAKSHKVYLLCGASGDYMGDTTEIEEYLRKSPVTNLRLVPVKPPKLAVFVNWFNKRGFSPIFYVAFRIWHLEAYRVASRIVAREKIDVVHQLGPIGFREPGYLWKLDLPFVWGPIGGAVFVNPVLCENLPIIDRFFFFLKGHINKLQLKYGMRIRTAAKRSVGLFFCSTENAVAFTRYLGVSGQIIPEQGTFSIAELESDLEKTLSSVRLVWAGRIARQKNLAFLFHTLKDLDSSTTWQLDLLGEGPQRKSLEKLSNVLGIAGKIIWHGKKTRMETMRIMSASDVHVMTSLFEGNPAVLFEAMSLGIPTISLDVGGMHDVLSNANGILIPVTTYAETSSSYVRALNDLIYNSSKRAAIARRTKATALTHSWEKKIEKFDRIYDGAILEYYKK